MPNYRRSKEAGATYFFTLVSYRRRPIFCDEIFRDSLRRNIIKVRSKYPLKIGGWVVLPDHMHCIWTLPPGDFNFSNRWSQIKRYVSLDIGKTYSDKKLLTASKLKKRESGIWQRRFWEHQIRDEADYKRHLDYIHYNPVRHGYCQQASDWPFSSIHFYIKKEVYPVNWAFEDESDSSSFGE